jgi:ubiquinone/menaquinone biosynthesis C-methylase UbiE
MAVASTFNARDAGNYERTMGRWSRRLAVGFAAFAGLAPDEDVLDVGCGTGSLLFHLADAPERPTLTGIDASAIYVAAAKQRAGTRPITVEEGDATALGFADGSFDRALSQLVFQFIPDARRAAAEMVRVVRPSGTIAAAVWASGGGMVLQRMFLDTAAQLDAAAVALRAHTFNRPMTRRGELAAMWQDLGLQDVVEDTVTIWMDHSDFADYWNPIAAGEGTLGRYAANMNDAMRVGLERHLRIAYELGEPDGPRSFAATSIVCRGIRPV